MTTSQKNLIKIAIALIILAIVCVAFYFNGHKNNKIDSKIETSPTSNTLPSTVYKSDSGHMEESPLTISGYKYALYLIGLNHSTCVPATGACSTYAFSMNQDNSALEVSNTNSVIATIPLTPLLDKLGALSKEKMNDPNGQYDYFTHEEMSLSYQNSKIKLKLYFDEVSTREENGTTKIENYKVLTLFSPL